MTRPAAIATLLLAVALVGCTTHRARQGIPGALAAIEIDWPERQFPAPGLIKKGSDFEPRSLGLYGNARVYGHPEDRPDNGNAFTITTQSERMGPIKKFHSHVTLTRGDQSGTLGVKNQRASFAVAYPAAGDTPTRGNIAFLTTLNTLSAPERSLIRHLTGDGWNVVAVTASTDLLSIAELESTEDGRVVLTAFSKPETLARLIDDHLAERAYATEAALAHLTENTPGWEQPTLVVLGASLGGLAVPATVARLGGQVDAAVLIAAGTRVPNIFTETTLKLFEPTRLAPATGDNNYAIAPLSKAETKTLADRATALSVVDPEKTAPALHGIPTLLLHARSDHIVPARYGRRLAGLLPHAERWTYPFGHSTLFVSLPFRNARIAGWIAAHTADPAKKSPRNVVN